MYYFIDNILKESDCEVFTSSNPSPGSQATGKEKRCLRFLFL